MDVEVQDAPNEKIQNGSRRKYVHFAAGFIAGITSRTATAPLDRLKVMAQFQRRNIFPLQGIQMMLKEGGLRSLWRGNGASVLKVAPEVSTKFLVYNELKVFLSADNKTKELSTEDRVIAGFLAGAISHSIVHPLEVCKTRLVLRQTGEKGGLWNTAKSGFEKNGWRFFFKGYRVSLFGIALFSCIDLTMYEKLKGFWKNSGRSVHTGALILFGVCSSLVAIVTCYPFSVIGVTLQASDERYTAKSVVQRVRERSVRNLYNGCATSVIKGVPTLTLSYLTYEMVIGYFGDRML